MGGARGVKGRTCAVVWYVSYTHRQGQPSISRSGLQPVRSGRYSATLPPFPPLLICCVVSPGTLFSFCSSIDGPRARVSQGAGCRDLAIMAGVPCKGRCRKLYRAGSEVSYHGR